MVSAKKVFNLSVFAFVAIVFASCKNASSDILFDQSDILRSHNNSIYISSSTQGSGSSSSAGSAASAQLKGEESTNSTPDITQIYTALERDDKQDKKGWKNTVYYSSQPADYVSGLVVIPAAGLKSPAVHKSDLGSTNYANRIQELTTAQEWTENVAYCKNQWHGGWEVGADNGKVWDNKRNVEVFQSNNDGLVFLIVGDKSKIKEGLWNNFAALASSYGNIKFYNWNGKALSDEKGTENYARHLRMVATSSYLLFPENKVAFGQPYYTENGGKDYLLNTARPACFLLKNGITVASFYGHDYNTNEDLSYRFIWNYFKSIE